MVKTLCKMPTSHIRVPGFESQLHARFQSPTNMHWGKQQVMPQVAEFLPPMWKTQIEFLAPPRAQAAIFICRVTQQMEHLNQYLPLTHSRCLSNKYILSDLYSNSEIHFDSRLLWLGSNKFKVSRCSLLENILTKNNKNQYIHICIFTYKSFHY